MIISNVPGPSETLYLSGARLEEVYPVSIPADYLSLNITITGYGDNLGFGFIACQRAMPALQDMPRFTSEALIELERVVLGQPLSQPKRSTKVETQRSPVGTSNPKKKATLRSPKRNMSITRVKHQMPITPKHPEVDI